MIDGRDSFGRLAGGLNSAPQGGVVHRKLMERGGICPSDMDWRAPSAWVLPTILDWSHLGLFALWQACWLQDRLRLSAPRPPRVAGLQATLGPWRGIRDLLPTASAPMARWSLACREGTVSVVPSAGKTASWKNSALWEARHLQPSAS